tara:strand:+ start:94 stop:798 length:705 start_codon:yes stop_codon:yes gene_type:complete
MEKNMKLMKTLFLVSFINLTMNVNSEIAEVYSYKANPGETAKMLEHMAEAAAIQREEGAHVTINSLDVGSQQQVDYVVRFDSTDDWGAIRDRLQANEKWNDFQTKIGRNPSGTLELSFAAINIDQTTTASSFPNSGVYGVWVWDVATGKLPEVLENFAKAKVIHEKLGARIEYYSEGLALPTTMHYVALFDNWSEMADFMSKAATDQELLTFQSSVDPNSATLVRQITGRTLPL